MHEINTRDLNELLEFTCGLKASDLHINVGSRPTVRHNSILQPIPGTEAVTPEISLELVDSILDADRKNWLEEHGDVDFSFSKPGLGRFRVNVYKQRGTYSMAIRSLPFNIPSFDSLGLPPVIRTLAKKPRGLVLATGPTGSGKSTTLASLVNIVNEERQAHIITIEDPIEYLHKHKNGLIDQREVGSDTKSFASALRATLREDPDVILVGEMRDPETISIALTAAETGHLVFSTLHTVGAAKTIDRIIDSFPPTQQNQVKSQLATVLEGVISQQLLPRKDGTGVVAAIEIMLVNPAIRNLIREGKSYQINSIIQTSAASGMQSLEATLAQLVTDGIITQEDAAARASDPQILFQLLNKRW
ncbi:MAG TPA: type IV pilus twitching motility protein PilT [Clostridia bacterium]|nr:type IV pilus twitching motility protein PilT [Clostridia bacterium]